MEIANLQIKNIRESKGITQQVLSQTTGIDQAIISQLEIGKIRLSLEYAIRLANGLSCTVDDLLGRSVEANDRKEQLYQAFRMMIEKDQLLFTRMARLHAGLPI